MFVLQNLDIVSTKNPYNLVLFDRILLEIKVRHELFKSDN